MPIALLLQPTFATYKQGSTLLYPWLALVRTEELLIARARSAFLVHWFGDRLPVRDNHLQVSIANLGALRQRWESVTRQQPDPGRGINLLEPMAGLSGTLVGVILSPSGAILGVHAIVRLLVTGVTEAGGVLAGLIGGPLVTAVGGIIGLLLLPLGFALAAVFGAAEQGAFRESYWLLGAIARLLEAVAGFIDQLLGPREQVRNPLIRSVLVLFDRVAVLLIQAFAVVAVLVTRIAPMILPLARQALAFRRVIDAVIDTIRAIIDRPVLGAFAGTIWASPQRGLGLLLDTLADGIAQIPRRLTALMQQMIAMLRENALAQLPLIISNSLRIVAAAVTALLRHPILRTILAVIARVQTVLGALPPRSSSSSPPPSSGFSLGSLPIGPPVPRPPSLPNTAAIQRFLGPAPSVDLPYGPAQVFPLAPETSAAAQRFRQSPPSVFAGERTRLSRELGQEPATALATRRVEDLRYRDLLYGIVTQIAPPEIRVRVPELLSTFEALDRYIYDRRGGERAEEFPVRDLLDNGRLRPSVARLTVRMVGGEEAETRQFAERVVAALRGQTYLARAGT